MNQTITISTGLYERLTSTARSSGFASIEQLLESWQASAAAERERDKIVRHIDDIRAKMLANYGEMPDSVGLIREDRERQ